MTNYEFLQNIEMDRKRKAEMNGPRREDIERISGLMSTRKPTGMMQGMVEGLGNAIGDFGIAIGRGSPYAAAQQMGNSYMTTREEEANEQSKAVAAMKFLQQEEKAKAIAAHREQQNQYRNNHLAEIQRHHQAVEASKGGGDDYKYATLAERMRHNKAMESKESSQDKKFAREDEKALKAQMRNDELQEKEPGAIYLDTLPTTTRNKYITAQQKALGGARARKEVTRITKKLHTLVKNNPVISQYSTALFNDEKGGKIGHLNMLRMSDKDRTALNTFKKYRNDLARLKVEAMAGTVRPNMFLDKIVSKSIGEEGMTRSALLRLFKNGYLESNAYEKADEKLEKDVSKGAYNQFNFVPKYEEPPEDDNEEELTVGTSKKQNINQSDESLLKAIQAAKARKMGMMQ